MADEILGGKRSRNAVGLSKAAAATHFSFTAVLQTCFSLGGRISGDRVRRAVSVIAVVAAHLLLLLSQSQFLAVPGEVRSMERDITVSLLRPPTQSEPSPELLQPEVSIVEAPDIQIALETPTTGPTGILAVPRWKIIPPRPDPTRLNQAPELPAKAKASPNLSALLRILVLQDGSVADAQVTRSTGSPSLDVFLLAYIKDHWHFLPASYLGAPVQDWTTVLVPFHT